MADRYVFIASFGFILAAIALLSARSDGGLLTDGFQPRQRQGAGALGVCSLVFFAAVTWQRVSGPGTTPRRFFTDTLRKDPANIFAAKTLARYYSVTVSTPEKAVPFLENPSSSPKNASPDLANPSLVHFEQYNLAELRNDAGHRQPRIRPVRKGRGPSRKRHCRDTKH
jgi:hypothetical protein